MAILDTLTVLIEADATGIDNVLKKTLNIITSTVGDMNKQEVGWTGILTRSVTPAIISGVAGMFAMALANSMSFQNSLVQTGLKVGMTADQMNNSLAPALKNIQKTTGVTDVEDLGSAYTSLFNLFGRDAKITGDVVEMLAKLEASGHGTASSLADSLLPVLQAWGATTKDSAATVINSFLNASEQGGVSIEQLAGSFGTFQGKLLNSGADLRNINDIVITFGVNTGKLGIDTAAKGFDLLSTALTGSNPMLNAAVGSVGDLKEHLKGNDIETALEQIFKKSSSMSPLLQDAFGLSVEAVGKFKSAVEQAPDISKQVEAAKTMQTTTEKVFDESSKTVTSQLKIQWAKLKVDSMVLGDLFVPIITSWVKSLDGFVTQQTEFWGNVVDGYELAGQDIKKGGFFGALNDMKEILPELGQTIGKFSVDAIKNMYPLQGMMVDIVASGLNGKDLNSLLRNSGFSNSQISSIDRTAGTQDIINGLANALQTGIKPGQYEGVTKTFNLNIPAGSQGLDATQIAQQLYRNFQGSL